MLKRSHCKAFGRQRNHWLQNKEF